MPTKLNKAGNQQNYVPKGNGDASGEYADNASGSNIHYFAKFAKPLPKSFTTKKATLTTANTSAKTNKPSSNNQTQQPQQTQKDNSKDKIKKVLEDFNKNTIKASDDSYNLIKDSKVLSTKSGGYQIDNVLDLLGFNGLPQVVDKDVFDEAVKQSSFIAQRGIGAPTKAILQGYVDQLYNGDFYVNCSSGGAQYGQGMYCAADYSGKITQGMKQEADDYANTHGSRGNVKIFTLTLAKDAKIVKHQDIPAEMLKRAKNDPKFTEFIARSVADAHWLHSYDSLSQAQKDFLNHEVEYRFTGDVKNHKKLTKAETTAMKQDFEMEKMANSIKNGIEDLKNIVTPNKNLSNYSRDLKVSSALSSLGLNDGSVSALMGFDAINAEGHGQSGSYTVILNRSKCLFLKD